MEIEANALRLTNAKSLFHLLCTLLFTSACNCNQTIWNNIRDKVRTYVEYLHTIYRTDRDRTLFNVFIIHSVLYVLPISRKFREETIISILIRVFCAGELFCSTFYYLGTRHNNLRLLWMYYWNYTLDFFIVVFQNNGLDSTIALLRMKHVHIHWKFTMFCIIKH